MRRSSSCDKALWLVLLILCCSQGAAAQSNEQTTSAGGISAPPSSIPLDANGNPLPYRPKDGDKLGYSKEESIRRLDPEVREFLDGILRLYKEPGLFANRRAMFATIAVTPGSVKPLTHSIPRSSETDPFRQYLAPQGIFARAGWSGNYWYRGRETQGDHTVWSAVLTVLVDHTKDCVNSKSIEGYLDLYLLANLDGKSHLTPASRWDRHGVVGHPLARPLHTTTPGIDLAFLEGCLARISVGNSFNNGELNDDNVFN